MGYDISYHPISEQEIQEWYFDALSDSSKPDQLCADNGVDDFYKKKYKDTVGIGAKTESSKPFDNTHGLYIAVIQGFFRTYFYTRGSAFSFLIEEKPHFSKYIKHWEDIIKINISNPIKNKITDNYSSGVFIPADQVIELLNDYNTTSDIKQELDNFYSHKRIHVFLKALQYCKENNLGLLEATEVITPDPLNLNKSVCYSNLFNCDKEGPFLYEEAAKEQIREIEKHNNIRSGTISEKAEYVVTNIEKPEKKGFWKRLFGK